MPLTRAEDIAELLRNARNIAMVGASDRPDRPSYGVMKFLQLHGLQVQYPDRQRSGTNALAGVSGSSGEACLRVLHLLQRRSVCAGHELPRSADREQLEREFIEGGDRRVFEARS